MRTIPTHVAHVLVLDRADLMAALGPCGRRVGVRPEVDLDVVERSHPALCRALKQYQWDTDDLWAAVRKGHPPKPAVRTHRVAAEHRQVTGKVGRADLVDVYEDLLALPVVADLVEEVTGSAPDEARVRDLAAVLDGSVSVDGTTWTVTFPLTGAAAWPVNLGGVPWPYEVSRSVTLVVKFAAWRDRRVRRLAGVHVHVDEVLADPARARTLLPAP